MTPQFAVPGGIPGKAAHPLSADTTHRSFGGYGARTAALTSPLPLLFLFHRHFNCRSQGYFHTELHSFYLISG